MGKKLFTCFIYISLSYKKINSTNHIAINSRIILSQKKVFFFRLIVTIATNGCTHVALDSQTTNPIKSKQWNIIVYIVLI